MRARRKHSRRPSKMDQRKQQNHIILKARETFTSLPFFACAREPIYCINFAEQYGCNSHQIRGIAAWVFNPSSWKNKSKKSEDNNKVGILWSTHSGNHIKIHQKQISTKKATLWGINSKIVGQQYKFPITGYLYINGESVQYKAKIASIEAYDEKRRAQEEKLVPKQYRENKHKTFLKLTELVPLKTPRAISFFTKISGKKAKKDQSLRNYVRIFDPDVS